MGYPADLTLIDCHFHNDSMESLPNATEIMEACNMAAMNIATIPGASEELVGSNAVSLAFKAKCPGRIYAFGGLDYGTAGMPTEDMDFDEQAAKWIEAGGDGFKLLEGKPTMRTRTGQPLDSPIYDAFYAFAESEQIPILFHVADPERFWDPDRVPRFARRMGWYYGDGDWPSKEQLYREAEGVLEKFPGLHVIFAHFYFLSSFLDRAAAFLDRWPNVSFDITPGIEMYRDFSANVQEAREFFVRYQDRILFGTDNNGQSLVRSAVAHVETMRRFLETDEERETWGHALKGIKLGEVALEKIYSLNFKRYAGEKPNELNPQAAVEGCKRAMELASATARSEETLPGLLQALHRLQELQE